jgi:hypothetical protein
VGARSRRGKCPKRFCESITLTIKSKSLNSQPTIKSGFEVSSPPTRGHDLPGRPVLLLGRLSPKDGFPLIMGGNFVDAADQLCVTGR